MQDFSNEEGQTKTSVVHKPITGVWGSGIQRQRPWWRSRAQRPLKLKVYKWGTKGSKWNSLKICTFRGKICTFQSILLRAATISAYFWWRAASRLSLPTPGSASVTRDRHKALHKHTWVSHTLKVTPFSEYTIQDALYWVKQYEDKHGKEMIYTDDIK